MTAPNPLREDEVEARKAWDAEADEFNQWDNLGGDEQAALIARAAILRLDQVREGRGE